LFTGARREEIGQLQIVDIQEEDGIPYFNITPEGDGMKTLKNEGSKRRVPIHSSLVKLGFLDYVQSIKADGHAQVFPQLPKNRLSKCSDPVGKWFARLLDKCGLSDPRLVLHSTRHNLVNGLRAAKCPRETIDLLDGHKDGSVHERYAHLDQLPMSLLKEGIELLRYDEVVKVLTKEVHS
jgi:integrase